LGEDGAQRALPLRVRQEIQALPRPRVTARAKAAAAERRLLITDN
jgi:hypothetical protein